MSQVGFWEADSEMEFGVWVVYYEEFLGPMPWRGREGEGKPWLGPKDENRSDQLYGIFSG